MLMYSLSMETCATPGSNCEFGLVCLYADLMDRSHTDVSWDNLITQRVKAKYLKA